MNDSTDNLSLGEAASRFLANLSPEEKGASQQEIYKFIRWYGWERPFVQLSPPDVANYAERSSLSDTDYVRKLELIRAFLTYAKKKGWSKSNLASHLKTRKGKTTLRSTSRHGAPEPISLTQEGYDELEAELATLKGKRSQSIEEMRKAAADKDFRENAPLQAAREQRGHLEGRIRELEGALKSANVGEEKQPPTPKVSLGDSITLCEVTSSEEFCYTLVNPREVDAGKGKISTVSPIGKAILGRDQGEIVEVKTPGGKLRYQIKQVKR